MMCTYSAIDVPGGNRVGCTGTYYTVVLLYAEGSSVKVCVYVQIL